MCGGIPTEINILLILSSNVLFDSGVSVKEDIRFIKVSIKIGFIK